MNRKKRTSRAKGQPDPRARHCFYLVQVTSFSFGGGATMWNPDDLPEIYGRYYLDAPRRPVLHEDLDLHLGLRPVDPPMPEIVDASAELHGGHRRPEPDYEFYGGAVSRRKDRILFWFHSSVTLTRDLSAVLLAGRTVFVRFQGSRLYRGKASLCGLEWWSSDHPDLLDELADLGDESGSSGR